MAGKRLAWCKRHGMMTEHYIRRSGNTARCIICGKHRSAYWLEYQRWPSRVAYRAAYYQRPEVYARAARYRALPEVKERQKRYKRTYQAKKAREATRD